MGDGGRCASTASSASSSASRWGASHHAMRNAPGLALHGGVETAAAAGLGDPEGNGPVKRGTGHRAARVVVPVLVRVVVKRAGRDRAPGALVSAFGL